MSDTKKMPSIFYAAQFAGPAYFKMINHGSKQTEGLHPWSRTITDTTDIALAVKQAKQMGVTGIKIYAELSPSLVQAITSEAHKQGLQAWSHVAVAPALPSDAIKASVNSMSHANDFVFEQFPANEDRGKVWSAIYKGLKADSALIYPLLQEMKRKNIILDATVLSASNNKLSNALLVTKWAHRIGVMIDAGTDWMYPTSGSVPLRDEMQTLVSQCGMSNREAISAATIIGAKAIGLDDRGVIEKGKRADVLILSNNPAIDLALLFEPEIVIQKGNVNCVKKAKENTSSL
jgi:imidazolonepropionase-like amidohydrolase